jgi:hypothetical protein
VAAAFFGIAGAQAAVGAVVVTAAAVDVQSCITAAGVVSLK